MNLSIASFVRADWLHDYEIYQNFPIKILDLPMHEISNLSSSISSLAAGFSLEKEAAIIFIHHH